jgi:hypothetical protein
VELPQAEYPSAAASGTEPMIAIRAVLRQIMMRPSADCDRRASPLSHLSY